MRWITLGFCMVCGVAAAAPGVDSKQIVPGKQLGKMHVGDLMEDLTWLKKPDFGDTAMGHTWQTWEATKPDPRNNNVLNSLDVYASLNDAGKYQIRIIRSTSPTFSTQSKLSVGSTFSEIKAQFPKLQKVVGFESPQFNAKVALLDDVTHGIAFEFRSAPDGSVRRHDKCAAIWVHEPGKDLTHEYISTVDYQLGKPSARAAAKKQSG